MSSAPLRILVCGGRNFSDYDFMSRVLDAFAATNDIEIVIHGAARGADAMADHWARKNRFRVHAFPADWNKHGKAAGVIRNRQMLYEGRPTHVFAFPGGKGTANMVQIATAAGLIVVNLNT